MQADIQNSMKRMLDYRFFWTDLYFLLNGNPKIKTHFTEARAARTKGYFFVFESLKAQKILKPASFQKEYQFLIDRMIDFSNTWLYASVLYDSKKEDHEIIEIASFQLLSLLYPYLTSEGQDEFKRLYPPYFLDQLWLIIRLFCIWLDP